MDINQAKYNNILFWLENHDWGRSVADAEGEPVLGKQEATSQGDYKLNPVDFAIEGYVVGFDAEDKVKALNAAFNSGKTGWLELPRLGKIRVKFKENGFRFQFEGRKENYFKLSLSLERADGDTVSVRIVKIAEDLEGKVALAKAEAEKSFLDKLNDEFSLDGWPEFVTMETFDNFTKLSAKISKLTAGNLVSSIVDPLTGSADILTSGSDAIFGAMSSYLKFDSGSFIDQIKACLRIASSKSAVALVANTPSSLQIYNNSKALDDLSKEIALSNACEIAAKDVFETKNQAEEFVDSVLEVSQEVALNTKDYKVQESIYNLVNQTINKVKSSNKLITTKTIRLNEVMPASIVAYDNGVSVDKFIRINGIRHPLFVPAGIDLEV